ncbi:tyrosine-type recombinase/integrase, partial [Pseudomonas reactans]|uniref:tyrosine-type recombinase/integrase n=1 Tax=Pseudomonas reactans TaxID=117680 RepID=UPI0034E95406
ESGAIHNELERLGVWEGDNPVGKVRALRFDETEMAYLEAEQIGPLLADLDARDAATGVVARICLATGARWSEAEGLTSRQLRGGLIHFARTKSSKNRTVPISKKLQKQIKAGLPFGDCYKKFEASVDAVVGGCSEVRSAGGAVDSCPAAYVCQPFHDEWRGYSDVAAGVGAWVFGDDHEVCAF